MKARGAALREIREMLAPFSFQKKDTVPLHKLEAGDYGFSNVAKHTNSNRKIVFKQIFFNDMDQERLKTLCTEYVMLMRATNRFLNPPIGFIFNNPIMIAMDERPNGNLYSAIKENKLDPTDKTKIAMGIAYGMRRLQKMHIVNGDLKSKNILLDEDLHPIVTDFAYGAIAHSINAPIQFRISDPYWCAPECLRGQPPSSASDVYSYGTLLAEMYTGTTPIGANVLTHGENELLPETAPRMMRALVKLCTSEHPSRRPDFRRIYRLFKTGNCYFEGADLKAIQSEVIAIKRDVHKSKFRFNPLCPKTPMPTRASMKIIVEKNRLLTQEKAAKKEITTAIPISVRERTGALTKSEVDVPQEKEKDNDFDKEPYPLIQTDLTKMNLSKGIALNSVKNTVLNVRGVRPFPKSTPQLQCSIQTRMQLVGQYPKESPSLDEGKIYLKLPRRSRKSHKNQAALDFVMKDRLYNSSQEFKPWKSNKHFLIRTTKSTLCFKHLMKQGRISTPCLQKVEQQSVITVPHQVMPIIRSAQLRLKI